MQYRFHDIAQNTDEWMQLRCGKVTASNFGIIMANPKKDKDDPEPKVNVKGAFGEPAKKYAVQIALERIRGFKCNLGFSNEHTERGHAEEPIAKRMYEAEHFVDVKPGGFFDHLLWGDSPDGLIGEDGVIEIKSVIAPTHYATLKRGSYDPAYKWQIAGHFDGTGRDFVDYISYCSSFPDGKQLLVYRYDRDDFAVEIEQLRERRGRFLELVDKITNELR